MKTEFQWEVRMETYLSGKSKKRVQTIIKKQNLKAMNSLIRF